MGAVDSDDNVGVGGYFHILNDELFKILGDDYMRRSMPRDHAQ